MTPHRRERLLNILDHRRTDIAVVLENVEDPRNVSAVLRSCDSVGIQDVYILTTKITLPEKFSYKSSRSAEKWLTIHRFSDIKTCFLQLSSRYSKIMATHLSESAVSVYQLDFTHDSFALVFGNEKTGISDEVLGNCHGNFVIPQVGAIKSLNISVACAVTIYEAFRQKIMTGHYDTAGLSAERKLELLKEWEAADLAKKRSRIERL